MEYCILGTTRFDMETESVTFVINCNLESTMPPDVTSKSYALCRVFNLKFSRIHLARQFSNYGLFMNKTSSKYLYDKLK